MAKQIINIGASPNDGNGDTIREAFNKANSNFTELYDNTVEAEARTYVNSVLCDNSVGAIYNAATPYSGTSILLDPTGGKRGAVCQIVIDGTIPNTNITASGGAAVVVAGEQDTNLAKSSLFIVYDFDGNTFWCSWMPAKEGALNPVVTPPTFTLSNGLVDNSIYYSNVVLDPNATLTIMEISQTENGTYEQVSAADYTEGNTSGNIVGAGLSFPLTEGNTYFVRLTSTLAGATDGITTESHQVDNTAILFENQFSSEPELLSQWTWNNAEDSVYSLNAGDLVMSKTGGITGGLNPNFGGFQFFEDIEILTDFISFQFTLDIDDLIGVSNNDLNLTFGLSQSTYNAANRIFVSRDNLLTSRKMRIKGDAGGVTDYDVVDNELLTNTIKIEYVPSTGDVKYFVWNAGWVEIQSGLSKTANIGTTIRPFMFISSNSLLNLNKEVITSSTFICKKTYTTNPPI